jgi:hypothetical protein
VCAADVGLRALAERYRVKGAESREETGRAVDDRAAPHRTLGWGVTQPGDADGWDDDQTRDQATPFLDFHGFEGKRSGWNERTTAAGRAGAGTGFTRGNRIWPWNSGAVRGRFDMINGRPLDMSRVVATAPRGRGEQEDDAQKCRWHSGPDSKQASHGNTHQARPIPKRRIISTVLAHDTSCRMRLMVLPAHVQIKEKDELDEENCELTSFRAARILTRTFSDSSTITTAFGNVGATLHTTRERLFVVGM